MKTLIKQKVNLIAECIFSKIHKENYESYGLYDGEFGLLLFLFYYSSYSKSKEHTLLTENYAEKLLEQFTEGVRLHTFCGGFAGILYLFEFLRENDFIDMDVSDAQHLLDNHLVFRMKQNISEHYYDFMHGALGVGLYFLKRGTGLEYIRKLIDFLYTMAEKSVDNRIFKWESSVMISDQEYRTTYNLALSHGISSIIIFLARVIKNGISDEKVTEMLSGAVNYVLSQEKDFSQFGSCFPNYILKDSPEDISKSRLAWCYGDLGIGPALWQAGKVFGKTEWKEKGLEIILQSTQRRNVIESAVRDAGICHGTAGITLIYRRMFLETGHDEFKEATNYWIQQTLNLSNFEDGSAGYKTLEKEGWKNDYSLLTGISGIGLVLLSYLEDNQQNWDEMFLLS